MIFPPIKLLKIEIARGNCDNAAIAKLLKEGNLGAYKFKVLCTAHIPLKEQEKCHEISITPGVPRKRNDCRHYLRFFYISIFIMLGTCISNQVCAQDSSGFSFPDIYLPDVPFPDIPLPPIQTFGNFGYTFQTTKNSDNDRAFRSLLNGTLIANSYIWQPWFSTVTSALTFSQAQQSFGSSETSNGNITGDLGFNILPSSDYPTTINFSRTDLTASAEETETETMTNAVSIGSRVKWDQTLSVLTNLDYSVQNQDDATEQTYGAFSVRVNKSLDEHLFNATIDLSQRANEETVSNGGTDQSTAQAILRHQFSPWENVFYDSTSSVLMGKDVSDVQESEQLTTLASSTLRWSPKEYPFSASAAWTALTDEEIASQSNGATASGITESKKTNLNGRLGLIYNYSDNLTMDASADGAVRMQNTTSTEATDSNANSANNPPTRITSGAAAGISYFQPPVTFKGFDWFLSTSARGSLSGGTGTDLSRTAQGNAGHTFSRAFMVPYIGKVLWSANENLSLSHTSSSQSTPVVPTLGHSTSFSHSAQEGNKWTLLSLTSSDNRTLLGDNKSSNQLINIQISKGLNTDTSSTWATNLSLQLTRQDSSASSSDGGELKSPWKSSSQGNISYNTRNIFDIRFLDFNSQISLTANQLVPVSIATTSADQDDDLSWNREWSSTLKYKIGQLGVEARFRLTQNQNRDITDFFQINLRRNF